jgi:hypothetical protein
VIRDRVEPAASLGHVRYCAESRVKLRTLDTAADHYELMALPEP